MKTDTRPIDLTRMVATLTQLPQLEMERFWDLWDNYFDQRPGSSDRGWLERCLAHAIQDRFFYCRIRVQCDADNVDTTLVIPEPVNIVALYDVCLRLCPSCSPKDAMAAIMGIFSDGHYYD